MSAKLSIAVVHGGTSSEKAFSTMNASYIARGLEENGHRVHLVDYSQTVERALKQLQPDLVFVAVQGKNHGDGTLQAICDGLKLPYTGSKAAAARVINDKGVCKKYCLQQELRTPAFVELSQATYETLSSKELFETIEKVMPLPVLAKAVSQGGGFGIEYIASRQDHGLVAKALQYDPEIVIEKYIEGKFVTSAVLEIAGKIVVLPPMSFELYGQGNDPIELYNNSFNTKQAKIIDAGLSNAQREELEAMSQRAFGLFGASNYTRLDFMLEEATGLLYFIEINAVPGLMGVDSFFPQAAERAGISYNKLLEIIVENEIQGGTNPCAI